MGITTTLKERRRAAGLDTQDEVTYERIPVELLRPNPNQPRTHIDESSEEFANLVGSIRERGLIQPISVWAPEPGVFVILGGERRTRAFRRLALDDSGKYGTIPAVVTRTLDGDANASTLMNGLIENVVREDLKPGDRARSVARLLKLTGWSYDEVADRMGVSRATISRFAAIGRNDVVTEAVNHGDISVIQAASIAREVGGDKELSRELVGVATRLPKEQAEDVVQQAVRTSPGLPAAERVKRAEAAIAAEQETESIKLSETCLAALKPRVAVMPRDDYVALVRKAWKELKVLTPAKPSS
jgi:ParB family transcriptional regulator, chromosome partitioning protein